MPLIPLCPKSLPGYSTSVGLLTGEEECVARVNTRSQERLRCREVQTAVVDESSPLIQMEARRLMGSDSFLQNLQTRWPSLKHVRVDKISSFNHPSPSNLAPLDQCILLIYWEVFNVDCRNFRHIVGTPDDLVLLRAAALYQAKIDTVGCLLYQNISRLTQE